jgi:hypothetical protein
MSAHSDIRGRELRKIAAKMRRRACTNRQIARTLGIDVKKVPAFVKLGETLLTLEPPERREVISELDTLAAIARATR